MRSRVGPRVPDLIDFFSNVNFITYKRHPKQTTLFHHFLRRQNFFASKSRPFSDSKTSNLTAASRPKGRHLNQGLTRHRALSPARIYIAANPNISFIKNMKTSELFIDSTIICSPKGAASESPHSTQSHRPNPKRSTKRRRELLRRP